MTSISEAMKRAGSNPPPSPRALEPAAAPQADDGTLTFVGRAMDVSGETASPTAAVLRPAGPMARPRPAVTRSATRRASQIEPPVTPRPGTAPTAIESSDPLDARQGIPLSWVVLGFGIVAIGVGFFSLPGGSDQGPTPIAASSSAAPPASSSTLAIASQNEVPVAFASNANSSAARALTPTARVRATMPVIERGSAAAPTESTASSTAEPTRVASVAASGETIKRAASGKTAPKVQNGAEFLETPDVIQPAPIAISEPAAARQNAMAMLEFYNLEGVFFSKTDPAAIINDRIVDPGDTIGDLKVIEIRRSSVIVEIAGQQLELR